MFYRMMGLWYSGLAFGLTIAMIIYAIVRCRAHVRFEKQITIAALCVFVFGSATHLPIMHRDYCYIPGYMLGYKISIGYMGFVVLLVLMARDVLASRSFAGLSERQKVWLYSGAAIYYVCAAISRVVLGQSPHRFPW